MRSNLAHISSREVQPPPGPRGACQAGEGWTGVTRVLRSIFKVFLRARYVRPPCFQPTPPPGRGPLPLVAGWRVGSSSKAGRLVVPRYYPPGIPTRYTHPVPPWGRTQPAVSTKLVLTAGCSRSGTCTNDRFGGSQGEPRGVEYRGTCRVPNTTARLRPECA